MIGPGLFDVSTFPSINTRAPTDFTQFITARPDNSSDMINEITDTLPPPPMDLLADNLNFTFDPPPPGLTDSYVTHTVPIYDYTYAERLILQQADCPRSGPHVPFRTEGEAQWAVLRRGCDRPVMEQYRDSDCCICSRCRLVFWNQPVPVHLYNYQKDLDMPAQGPPPDHKRSVIHVDSDLDITSGPPTKTVNTTDDEVSLVCHETLNM